MDYIQKYLGLVQATSLSKANLECLYLLINKQNMKTNADGIPRDENTCLPCTSQPQVLEEERKKERRKKEGGGEERKERKKERKRQRKNTHNHLSRCKRKFNPK